MEARSAGMLPCDVIQDQNQKNLGGRYGDKEIGKEQTAQAFRNKIVATKTLQEVAQIKNSEATG
jgi:hypothetical protein